MAVVANLRKTQINLEDNLEDRCNYAQLSAQVKISILSSQTLVHAIIACYSSASSVYICAPYGWARKTHLSLNKMLSVLPRLHRESKKLVQYNVKAT